MKYILIIAMALLFAIKAFGQQSGTGDSLTIEDYLTKSKHRKTAAWTFFGIGTATIGGGLLIATAHRDDPVSDLGGIYYGSLLVLAGTLADLISIPLFISASKSKKQAASFNASIKFEDLSPTVGSVFHQNTVPALSMKYRF